MKRTSSNASQNRSSRGDEPSQTMSPAIRLSLSYPLFLLQFFTASGGTGAPATSDGQPQRRGRQGTGANGARGLNYPIRPLWSTGNKNNNITINIHPPFRSHTHQHHHPPCQPTTTTTFRCLTTHTRSWGWVVKHRPQPAHFAVGWPKTAQPSHKGCGTGAPSPRKHDTTTTTNTTSTRHASSRSHPSARIAIHLRATSWANSHYSRMQTSAL